MRRSEFLACLGFQLFIFRSLLTKGSLPDRYHVERFLREVIIPRLAPISREMCLNYIAEKVLDLPKSY